MTLAYFLVGFGLVAVAYWTLCTAAARPAPTPTRVWSIWDAWESLDDGRDDKAGVIGFAVVFALLAAFVLGWLP